jgi:hypothetical protein
MIDPDPNPEYSTGREKKMLLLPYLSLAFLLILECCLELEELAAHILVPGLGEGVNLARQIHDLLLSGLDGFLQLLELLLHL